MHLLALSWDAERPGWLDPRVHRLARAVTEVGATCEIVTLGSGPTATRAIDGVTVTWAMEAPPVLPATPDYDMARVLATATRTSAIAEQRCQHRAPDAVLAFGWHTAWTAATLRSSRATPLVAVLDSTAPGRAGGALDAVGRLAAQVEWWLTYEARRVVAPSAHVAADLRRWYRLPADKVDVLAPGIDPPEDTIPDPGRVVVLAPRPVADAVHAAIGTAELTTDPGAVTGAGVVVVFDGDPEVVLTAMAAGAAVIVPEDGPLRDLVHARRSGLRVARTPAAVAMAVQELLGDPRRRQRLGAGARQRVLERHAWQDVAVRHLAIATRAAREEASLAASADVVRPLRPMLLRSPLA